MNSAPGPAYAKASSGRPPLALVPRLIVNLEAEVDFTNAAIGDMRLV